MEKFLEDPRFAKGLAQLSTALRTLSKVFGNGSKTPDENKTSQSPQSSPPEPTLPALPQVSSWVEQVMPWVLSGKCRWGLDHGYQFAKFVVGKRWRADNLRNHWRFIGPREGLEPETQEINKRANWRPCSTPTVLALYREYTSYLEDSKAELLELHEFHPEKWEAIRPSKRKRMSNILNAKPISEKQFMQILKDNHKDFKPLRKLRVVK